MANAKSSKTPKIPDEYTPISMWGYFGYEILFSIPVIGLICIIIFALTANNHNLKNFARSQFCLVIVVILLTTLMLVSGVFAALLQELI